VGDDVVGKERRSQEKKIRKRKGKVVKTRQGDND
jgi:hypothetical protein